MYRHLSVQSSITGLLMGLMLIAVGGGVQTVTAQQPTLDSDQPLQSLKQSVVTTAPDSKLVVLATALQKARADTEISYREYRDGVRFFQKTHPGFYGNFFGDPFYATYDVRYTRLVRERQSVEPDINPQSSFRNNGWFFCSPLAYDPAFNGQCRGFEFGVSDFFFLPSGPAFGPQALASKRDRVRVPTARRDIEGRTRSVAPAPSEPDTSRVSIANAPTPNRSESGRPTSDAIAAAALMESGLDLDPASTPDEISVPDRIETPEREVGTAPDHVEAISRIRALVQRERNGDRLSAEERREVMSTVRRVAERQNAEQTYSRNERSDRLRRRVESQIDRDHEFTDQSPRTRSDVDRPQTENDRSDARSGRSPSRDRSEVDDSSDDETEN